MNKPAEQPKKQPYTQPHLTEQPRFCFTVGASIPFKGSLEQPQEREA